MVVVMGPFEFWFLLIVAGLTIGTMLATAARMVRSW